MHLPDPQPNPQPNTQLGQCSTRELEQWRDEGYFVRSGQLGDTELTELREAADRVAETYGGLIEQGEHTSSYLLDGNRFVDIDHITVQYEHQPESKLIRVIEPVHELDNRLSALIADQRLLAPMRRLVNSTSIAVWTAKLNYKHPRGGSGFGWHQDSPYWIHDSAVVDQLPNVFVAIDDAHADNGGLRLIRGSHTRGVLAGRADGSQLEGFYTHESAIDENRAVTPNLPAGSFLFFSPHLVHGSRPNRSDQPRRALIATYQPAGLPELKSGRIGRAL